MDSKVSLSKSNMATVFVVGDFCFDSDDIKRLELDIENETIDIYDSEGERYIVSLEDIKEKAYRARFLEVAKLWANAKKGITNV